MSKEIIVPPSLAVIAALAHSIGDFGGETRSTTGVECSEDDKTVSFSATDGRVATIVKIAKSNITPATGKAFPDISAVVPVVPPLMTMKFDSKRLRDMLLVVQSLGVDFGSVMIEWHGEQKPAVVRAGSMGEDGVEMIGLIMPIKTKDEDQPHNSD